MCMCVYSSLIALVCVWQDFENENQTKIILENSLVRLVLVHGPLP